MIQTLVLTFLLFLAVVAAMAIGYMVQRKSISGSCGGLGAVGVDKVCSCEEPCDNRKKKMAREAQEKAWKENQII